MHTAPRRRQYGLTLVEIMVAIAVSLVLLTGVIQIFAGTKATYRVQENLGRLQENGRFALDFLARDIRMAGYTGCGSGFGTITNTLNGGSGIFYNFTVGIEGFDNVGASPPTYLAAAGITPKQNTDVIIVRRNSDNPIRISRNNDSAQLFAVTGNVVEAGCADGTTKVDGLCRGDILMVSDCQKSRVFQAGNITPSGSPPNQETNITHPASGTPGNAVSSWGGASAPPEQQFNQDAEIVRVGTYAYFVAANPNGGWSLFRLDGGVISELVEGVEDMQVVYGEDTDPNDAFRQADVYRDATAVFDWNQVVSARVHLLLRSNDNNLAPAPQDYTFNGATVAGTSLPPTDRFLRREFTATITLRNRAS